MTAGGDDGAARWRSDLDALEFPVGEGACLVHRLAFRTLLDGSATPEACMALYAAETGRFRAAATAKIARAGLSPGARFHLTSRDLRRAAPPRFD
ncbi:hypothetical protein [Amorphus sp. MBR-141]